MMQYSSIGLLHPGEMGAAVGDVLAGGHPVWWASSGRSPASDRRACAAGLTDVGSVEAIRHGCELIISICPPEAALDVARQLSGFQGVYLDANAIAPGTAGEVATLVEAGGGSYLDGGIIGGPPHCPLARHPPLPVGTRWPEDLPALLRNRSGCPCAFR
jgi:3-hydroxyisobutyrate dehydrogenase-like beta-hydroxyacid dehydrogenase